jgi:hypothetical protein
MTIAPHTEGLVASGFEEVHAEFERNFAERGEISAARRDLPRDSALFQPTP